MILLEYSLSYDGDGERIVAVTCLPLPLFDCTRDGANVKLFTKMWVAKGPLSKTVDTRMLKW